MGDCRRWAWAMKPARKNSWTVCLGSEVPDTEIKCLMIEGQDEDEKSANLVRQLAADKLL